MISFFVRAGFTRERLPARSVFHIYFPFTYWRQLPK
jgi:hypothetical protein